MAVAFDAKGTKLDWPTPASPLDYTTLTVGTGFSRGLVVFVSYESATTLSGSETVTWDPTGTNQACTLLGTETVTANRRAQIWGLLNPVPGNKTLRVTGLGTATHICIEAASFTGVVQTNTAAAFVNFNSATGTGVTASVTITSTLNNLVVGHFLEGVGSVGISATNGSNIFIGNMAASTYLAGAASVAASDTQSNEAWAAQGLSIADDAAIQFGELIANGTGTVTGANTGTSVAIPINGGTGVAVKVGDLVIALLSEQTSITSTTCADNLGNIYTALATSGTTCSFKAYYSRVSIRGTLTTITITTNGGNADFAACAACYNGPFAGPVTLDKNPSNLTNDTTNPILCPSSTTLSQPAELVVGMCTNNAAAAWTATTPMTKNIEATRANAGALIGSWVVADTTAVVPAFDNAGTAGTANNMATATFRQASFVDMGWFVQPTQPPHPRREKASGIVGRNQFAITPFTPTRAHIQEWQPQRRATVRAGAIMPSEPGNEAIYVTSEPVIPSVTFVHEGPSLSSTKLSRAAAASGRSQFSTSPNFPPVGWEILPPQPPVRAAAKNVRTLSSMRGDDGILAEISIAAAPQGWEVRPHQPQHVRSERAASAMRGDDGISDVLRKFLDHGFSIRSVQPPARPYRKMAAAAFNADASDQNDRPGIVQYPSIAWDVMPTYRALAAAKNVRTWSSMRGSDGLDYPFFPLFDPLFDARGTAPVYVFNPAGANVDFANINVGTGSDRALVATVHYTATGSQAITATWDALGVTPQTMTAINELNFGGNHFIKIFGLVAPHSGQLTLRFGTTAGCNSDFYVDAMSVIGADQAGGSTTFHNYNSATGTGSVASVTIASAVGEIVVGAQAFSSGSFITIASVNNNPIFISNAGSTMEASSNYATGSASVSMFATETFALQAAWGANGISIKSTGPATAAFDVDAVQRRILKRRLPRGADIRGDDGTADRLRFVSSFGFPRQSPQPNSPSYKKTGAVVARGDDGTQGAFLRYNFLSWENNERVRRIRSMRPGSIRQDDSGIHGKPLLNPVGWEVLPPIFTAYPKMRAAGTMRGDEGTLAAFASFIPRGWETQPPQPPSVLKSYPRIRAAATMRGDDGAHDILRQWFVRGWEIQDQQPPHRRPEKSVAVIRSDTGIQGVFVQFWNIFGWSAQDVQPPHPSPERRSGFLRGDDGTQSSLVRFFPYGWEVPSPQPPTLTSYPKVRAAGTLRGDDGNYATMPPVPFSNGWGVQEVQPPHPRPERSVGAIRGDDGTQASLVNWIARGWDVQDVQPRHPAPERSGSFTPIETGTEAALSVAIPPMWEGGQWQPSSTQRIKLAGTARGDDGTQDILRAWFVRGWEVQDHQPQRARWERSAGVIPIDPGIIPPVIVPVTWNDRVPGIASVKYRRLASTLAGDEGINAAIVPPVLTVNWGYGQTPVSQWKVKKWEGSKGVSRFSTFPNLQSFDWEMLSWQPPHLRPEKSASLMIGDDGNQDIYVPPILIPLEPVGWEMSPSWQAPHRSPEAKSAAAFGKSQFATFPDVVSFEFERPRFVYHRLNRWSATKGGTVFAIYPPFLTWSGEQNWKFPNRNSRKRHASFPREVISPLEAAPAVAFLSWDAPHHNQHPRPERAGSLMPLETGIQATLIFTPPLVQDQQWHVSPRWWRAAAIVRRDGWEAPIAPSIPVALDAQWNPKFRWNRFDSTARGDDGTQSAYLQWNLISWGAQDQLRRPSPKRPGAVIADDSGVHGKPLFLLPDGWEVQPPQHQAFLPRIRAAAIARGDDGTQDVQRFWYVRGWETQDPQPQHLRSERAASIMPIETGTEAPLALPSLVFITESGNQQWQPPTLRWWRSASSMRGDDGTQDTIRTFPPLGYPIQLPQPPHPAPERRVAGTLRGDDGVQFRFVIPLREGWEVQPPQPPHPHPEIRSAGTMRGDDGTQFRLVVPFREGWKIQDVQPPHPHPEFRAAGTMRGDEGNYDIIRTGIPLLGFPIQFPQPPHPIPERRAAGNMRGDDGNQAIYVGLPPVPEGWQIQFPQPPHPRPERVGSVMPIEPGIAAPFIIGATGPTLTWDMFQPTPRAYVRVAGALMRGIDFAQAGPIPIISGWEFMSSALAQRISPRAAALPSEFARLFIPLEVSPAAWVVDPTELIRPRRRLTAVDAAKFVPPLFPRVWGFDEPLAFLRRARARSARGLQRLREVSTPFFAFVPWQEPIPIQLRFVRRPSILGELVVPSPPQPLFPFPEGWESLLANPPHTRVERSGSVMLGDISGTWGTLSLVIIDPTKSTTINSPVWLAVSYDIGLPPRG